jgi:hypothetical protein
MPQKSILQKSNPKNIYTAKISMQHEIQEEGLSGLPPAFQGW